MFGARGTPASVGEYFDKLREREIISKVSQAIQLAIIKIQEIVDLLRPFAKLNAEENEIIAQKEHVEASAKLAELDKAVDSALASFMNAESDLSEERREQIAIARRAYESALEKYSSFKDKEMAEARDKLDDCRKTLSELQIKKRFTYDDIDDVRAMIKESQVLIDQVQEELFSILHKEFLQAFAEALKYGFGTKRFLVLLDKLYNITHKEWREIFERPDISEDVRMFGVRVLAAILRSIKMLIELSEHYSGIETKSSKLEQAVKGFKDACAGFVDSSCVDKLGSALFELQVQVLSNSSSMNKLSPEDIKRAELLHEEDKPLPVSKSSCALIARGAFHVIELLEQKEFLVESPSEDDSAELKCIGENISIAKAVFQEAVRLHDSIDATGAKAKFMRLLNSIKELLRICEVIEEDNMDEFRARFLKVVDDTPQPGSNGGGGAGGGGADGASAAMDGHVSERGRTSGELRAFPRCADAGGGPEGASAMRPRK